MKSVANIFKVNISKQELFVIIFAVFLAELGVFYLYGEGLLIENTAHQDEAFVIDNAISIAYNGFNYSLDDWRGYKYYSPFFAICVGLVIKGYTFLTGMPAEMWRTNFEELLVVGRHVNIALFCLSLFALLSIFRKLSRGEKTLPLLGILTYISILGPVHVANIARAEGAVLAMTIIFLWSLFEYGPKPTLKGWVCIILLGTLTVSIEIYGLVVVGNCLLFFLLNERMLSYKETINKQHFTIKTFLLVCLLTLTAISLATFLNWRILYVLNKVNYNLLNLINFASGYLQSRLWEVSVMFGVAPKRSLFAFLALFFETLSPFLIAGILYTTLEALYKKIFIWWIPVTWCALLFWGHRYASGSGGPYLFFPVFPLIVFNLVYFLRGKQRYIHYTLMVICVFALFRITVLQIAKFYDKAYYETNSFVFNKNKGITNVSMLYYSLKGHRHIFPEKKAFEIYNNNPKYFRSLPLLSEKKPSLLIQPADWEIASLDEIYPNIDSKYSIAKIDNFLQRDFSVYKYVVVDNDYMWFRNYWNKRRNPELAVKWEELYEKLKMNRQKVYETGSIDSRFLLQGAGLSDPPWTGSIVAEIWAWLKKDMTTRGSPFGPHVEVYEKEVQF